MTALGRGAPALGGAALLCAAAACSRAPADAWRGRPAYLGDARMTERSDAAYAPPARATAAPGNGTIALRTTGAEEQARATALRYARALLAADAVTLTELLPARVVLALDGTQKPRDELIERCLKDARALTYAGDHDPAAIIDVRAMRVGRAGDVQTAPLPAGIDPADLTVTLPARDRGESPRPLPCMTTLYVRTGQRDRIVGLAR